MSDALQFLALGTGLLIGLVAVGALVVLWAIATYNGLVAKRINCTSSWAQIDVQLKRRYDLIPNLVETVKGYAAHEKETFQRVIAARNQAAAAVGPAQVSVAEGLLSGAMRQLFAVAEAYPDLKANQNFRQLQEELATTENQISFARQSYNHAVQAYNSAIATFPTLLLAGLFAFREEDFFELIDSAQRETPKVSFTS